MSSAPPVRRPLARRLPDTRRVAIALTLAVVAMGGRAALDPWLDDHVPFLLAWPAVASLAVTVGPWPATIAAALCAAWVAIPWVPPTLPGPAAAVVFLATAVGFAWLVPRLSRGAIPRPHAAAPDDASVHHDVVTTLRWVVLMAALVPLCAYVGLGAWQLNVRTAEAYARMERIARVAAEHTAKIYETNEMLLRRVFDLLGDDDDARLRAREPALHARLVEMTRELPQVQSIWVQDARGRPLLGNRFSPPPAALNVADREFFVWHRERRGGLFITEALVGRVTHDVFSDLSLRRERPDGTFAGVVTVGLFVNHFDAVLAELAGDLPGAAFALLRADGRYIARVPGPTPVGATLPDGNPVLAAMRAGLVESKLEAYSTVDGALRQVAFRRVPGYPVYVSAGLTRADVLARWREDMALLAVIVVPLTVGLVALAWIALRRAEQGLAAVERLQTETAQRLRVEAALRQSQKLEALGRLTGGVAHDFNNLLTVVSNNVHVLRRTGPAPSAPAQLAAIERAVRTGAQLTRQLLAFSRRQVMKAEVLRLQDLLPELTVLIRPMLPPGIDLEVDVDPATAPIECDRAELELALLNLVSNARDAMPEGGRVRIVVRDATPAEAPEVAGPAVRVEVSDTGTGIAPELLERVFEPFFSTKPTGAGTGLGLAQVQALCRGAGGLARLRSAPGEGTVVTLLLAAAGDRDASPAAEDAVTAPRALGLRVLLVEDNPEVAAATRELLETMGCTVRRVADAHLAVDALGREDDATDVVLSDIAMPGAMDGVALGGWIRANRPDTGVVLMTGYAERLGRAAEQGLLVLPKPCAPSALAQALWDAHRAARPPSA